MAKKDLVRRLLESIKEDINKAMTKIETNEELYKMFTKCMEKVNEIEKTLSKGCPLYKKQ
jgi:hypothetical protein